MKFTHLVITTNGNIADKTVTKIPMVHKWCESQHEAEEVAKSLYVSQRGLISCAIYKLDGYITSLPIEVTLVKYKDDKNDRS